jgi:hypothetical protein
LSDGVKEEKGFFRRVIGYFKTDEKAAKATQPAQNEEITSPSPAALSSGFNSANISIPAQNLGTPPHTEEDEEASEIELSLCGHLITDAQLCRRGEDVVRSFNEHRIPYEDFAKDPHSMLSDPRFIIRIDQNYYNWRTAAPLLISMLAFKRSIPNEIIGHALVEVEPQQNSAHLEPPLQESEAKRE